MVGTHYEPLSGQDNAFLLWETPRLHMHVSAVQIYESGPVATAAGGIDFGRIQQHIAACLQDLPRYRQRLEWIPFEKRAVWVDDEDFDLDYHVRHAALPTPGDEKELKRFAARIMARQLDRRRPLWEMWIVEGLDDDHFATISKIHHCMVDGISGVDMIQILQTTKPDLRIRPAPPFEPRPAPTHFELFADRAMDRLRAPYERMKALPRDLDEARERAQEVRERMAGVFEAAASQLRLVSPTPLNGEVGPDRSFEWLRTPLEDLRAIRSRLSCTLNDVVLTVAAGAVRTYLLHHDCDPAEVQFQVQAPVSVRRPDEVGVMGNRVSSWIVRLPVGEPDPLTRLECVVSTTRGIKESRQAVGVASLMEIMNAMPTGILSLGAQAISGVINTIVTNVPGPQHPLYMLGAEVVDVFGQVPLPPNCGLGIALMSYNGSMNWAFNADPNIVPDVATFRAEIHGAIEYLAEAAGVELSPVFHRGRRARSGDRESGTTDPTHGTLG
jgi:WS/DGAT/MGAT family acyltransferase